MKTGPNKKPNIPTVVTDAKAKPDDIVFECPATEYAKGTIVESPKPATPKPMITVNGVGKPSAIIIPKPNKVLLIKIIFLIPAFEYFMQ